VPQIERRFPARDDGVFGLAVETVGRSADADALDDLRRQIVVLVARFDPFAPPRNRRIRACTSR